MNQVIVEKTEFNLLLKEFQEAINVGKYTEKIPYNTWRKLKSAHSITVKITSNIIECFVYDINVNNAFQDFFSFPINSDFGKFLYEKLIFVEGENKDMITEEFGKYLENSGISTVATSATVSATSLNNLASSFTDCTWKITDNLGSSSTTDCAWKIVENSPNISTIHYNAKGINGVDNFSDTIENIKQDIDDLKIKITTKEDKKENSDMISNMKFDFGPCGNTVRLSMYGLAIQNVSGEWVSYNRKTNSIFNVDILNIADGGKYIYKMPAPISNIEVGDIIIHARTPMFVNAINENGTLDVTDVRAGETKNIILTRSPFGFDFITKVVNLFDNFTNGAPSAEQPFGNMLPFIMMSENKEIDPMLMFMMMNQNGNNINFMNNPMMMYFLMKDGSNSKEIDPMLMFIMMSNGNFNSISNAE